MIYLITLKNHKIEPINRFNSPTLHDKIQGCNARKVISEVYTSFVLQCTVSGR